MAERSGFGPEERIQAVVVEASSPELQQCLAQVLQGLARLVLVPVLEVQLEEVLVVLELEPKSTHSLVAVC